MQLQPAASPFLADPRLAGSTHDHAMLSLPNGTRNGMRSGVPAPVALNASVQTEYLNIEKYSLEFTSKDGDKVSFSMESVQYQKALLEVQASGSSEDMQKIADFIAKEYADFRDKILEEFLKRISGKAEETPETEKKSTLHIPEYWNAENTSQRIVDFALQFFGAFEGSGEEFLAIIKGAIDKGFNEARDMLGELPEPVSELINDTYDLVMQKLDLWAQEKGISTQEENNQNPNPEAIEVLV
ncbi:MAG: DUF5610 domain-containing protein [Chitinispirillaceae bacterium]|nr:DUF5610 domain-containing protein [Chitinispirillaceae bacterium]